MNKANAFAVALLGESKFIHWASTPDGICARKDIGADAYSEEHGETTIIHSAVASHPGNVTCPRCKRWRKSERWRKSKK